MISSWGSIFLDRPVLRPNGYATTTESASKPFAVRIEYSKIESDLSKDGKPPPLTKKRCSFASESLILLFKISTIESQ